MRRMSWAMCVWPGLPQAWRGEWSGLALAIGFSLTVNFLVVCSWAWTDLVSWSLAQVGWSALGGVWLWSAVISGRMTYRARVGDGLPLTEDLFRTAQNEYLKGNWFEAERSLAERLEHYPRDVESRLLLATLWRRTKRFVEAKDQLDQLELLSSSSAWANEIVGERERLEAEVAQVTEELARRRERPAKAGPSAQAA